VARILVLDDSVVDRRLLCTVLQHGGHEAIEATTGPEALEKISGDHIDLVVTDLLMPDMDGYEFVRRLRAEADVHQPRVVFYTATYDAEDARLLGAAAAVSEIIVKPVEPDVLLRMLERVMAEDAPRLREAGEEFDREHLRVLNRKLLDKIEELRALTDERRRLLADVVNAQESERARIATEIHDDSIQVMSAAGLRLDMLVDRIDDPEAREALTAIGDVVGRAVSRLRHLMFDLRPRALDTSGVATAIAAYLRETAVEGPLDWQMQDRLSTPLDGESGVILYRIAQEAVRNARKHAGSADLEVVLDHRDGGVALEVRDDGAGCDVEEAMSYRPGHLGLVAMRERAEVAGGWMSFASSPGMGSTVTAWLPVNGDTP
jgi:signal transduction histidine kinase